MINESQYAAETRLDWQQQLSQIGVTLALGQHWSRAEKLLQCKDNFGCPCILEPANDKFIFTDHCGSFITNYCSVCLVVDCV